MVSRTGLLENHAAQPHIEAHGAPRKMARMLQDRIAQKRMDALCARILHERPLRKLRHLSLTVDVLALVVPVGYMTVRFLAKGTAYKSVAEFIWACVAAALLILSITKMVFKWTDKSQQHSRLIGENISLVTHANHLLSKSPSPDGDTEQLFFYICRYHRKS